MRVAILGAAGTGKTSLCAALRAALRDLGEPAQVHDDTALGHLLSELRAGFDASTLPCTALAEAVAAQRAFDHTLLCALDLPTPGAPLPAPSSAAWAERERHDARLRALLAEHGIVFRVVYGLGAERLRNALGAVGRPPPATGRPQRLRAWACERCGDAACEHRLFTQARDRTGG